MRRSKKISNLGKLMKSTSGRCATVIGINSGVRQVFGESLAAVTKPVKRGKTPKPTAEPDVDEQLMTRLDSAMHAPVAMTIYDYKTVARRQ